MQTNRMLKIATSMLLAVLLLSSAAAILPAFAPVNIDNFPRLDDLYWTVSYPEATAMVEARAGTIDSMMGMINPDNVEELRDDYSWSVSANPGFHMCYLGINSRDHPPVLAGPPDEPYIPGAVYGNRTPAFSLYPLNVSDFRYVLNILIGCQKDAWISTLYRFINVRLDTNIPPASPFWYNAAIPPVDYDPTEAYNILTTDLGFSNSSGYWVTGKGSEMRPIYIESPQEAPPSVALASYCVGSWNAFFGTASTTTGYHETTTDEGYYFHNYAVPFYDEIDHAFLNRDFDIYMLCWGLSRDPDYLYYFFHPDLDFYDGNNSPGLTTPDGHLEDMLYAIAYFEWPNGTAVPSTAAMQQIVYDTQWELYYLVPYIPLYSRAYHNMFTPGLKGWIESLGYGSDNFWTRNWIYWGNDLTKTSMRYHLAGPISKFHPATSSSVYENNVLGVVLDGGLAVNPFNHENINWGIKSYTWTAIEGTTPWGEPVDGTQLNIVLRTGIKWHDGQVADCYDAKFNFDTARAWLSRNLYAVGSIYVNSSVTDATHMTVWFNGTGLWHIQNFLASMFVLAPQIYQGMNKTVGEAFQPWLVDYTTHTGNPKPAEYPFLTCLIGTGPQVFVQYDAVALVAHTTADRAYYFARTMKREDINFDGKVDISDISASIADFGAIPGHPRWAYGKSDVTADYKIDISDIARVISKFGAVTLPP